ncbi:hypothetical protein Clacol_000329 [Clathrus columnatus]|uniref:Carboxypeptidase n=1 Tax=Clathrus columnatus TaxID=1419009 RepID=A0AAV4ZZH1_9AGAM|nr:hypothetical protein Clacol_000329 [Clathrus columnatus]
MENTMQIQRDAIARLKTDFLGPTMQNLETTSLSAEQTSSKKGSTITFHNPKAAEFFVDGTSLPDVTFDVGPSWSGLLPISGAKNETRKLFFWFWPANNPEHGDELLFWTNGGPGCSSLEGFFQENGPVTWSWGQAAPTLTTGWDWFTQGEPSISNDDELAAQVIGFLQQFLEIFSELKGKNFYVSGESYAGFYVPYIANWIYEHPGLELNLKGIFIADPSLSYDVVQQEIPALRFVQVPPFSLTLKKIITSSSTFEFRNDQANQNLFPFNSSFMQTLQTISDNWQLPFPVATNGTFSVTPECRIHSPIQRAVNLLNPAFDHCTDDHRALPNVIEKSERTIILHGLADFILVAEGTRIAIQNMTWNGTQGFQTPIQNETFILKDMGVLGNAHTERGLTYVEFYYSGHMTPRKDFLELKKMLGQSPF